MDKFNPLSDGMVKKPLPGKIPTKENDENDVKKSIPFLGDDRTITFGYYGIGKWSHGTIEDGQIEEIKEKLKVFLSKNKWSDKVMIAIKADSFWVYVKIKLK